MPLKAVITSAGKGTRMRYISHVIPKAMLPVFKTEDGKRMMRPLIDVILEFLKGSGVTEFATVSRKDNNILNDYLSGANVTALVQTEPKGFGDAVLTAEKFVGRDPFFVHTDDTFVNGGYADAARIFSELKPDCLLLLSKVDNPSIYGIIEGDAYDEIHGHEVYSITGVEEKPLNPKSKIAMPGINIFSPKIFEVLKNVDYEGELQLTYGIQELIRSGCSVYGMLLDNREKWLDLGNPENYFHALSYTYNHM